MAVSGNRVAQVFAVAVMLAGLPAMGSAQAVTEDEVIADLQREGFMVVDTGTTLLGRLRITALEPEGTREVVLNPRSGKVLRDVMIEDAPEAPLPVAATAKVAPVATEALPEPAAPPVAANVVPDPVSATPGPALPEQAAPIAHLQAAEQSGE